MNEQTLQVLRELGAKLGVTGEYIWHVLVAGAYFDGVWMAFLTGIFVAGAAVFSILAYRYREEYDCTPFAVCCGFAATGYIFGLMTLYAAVLRLSMPEYVALGNLIRMLSGDR